METYTKVGVLQPPPPPPPHLQAAHAEPPDERGAHRGRGGTPQERKRRHRQERHIMLRGYRPTNIGTARATPTATPLVVISDGGQNLGRVRLLQGFLFFPHFFNTCSGVGTTRH